jgi:RimJ/RimL family protein N-acetyltransferase
MQSLYQNDTIRIRPYEIGDEEKLLECVTSSLDHFSRYLPWAYTNYSSDDSEIWMLWTQKNWRLGLQYDFVIERIEDKKFLGGVGILDVNYVEATASLGYFIRNDEAGKGTATAAAKLVIQFIKQEMGLRLLNIYTATDNIPSIRVAEKLGAELQSGVIENYEVVNGRQIDSYFYQLKLNPSRADIET